MRIALVLAILTTSTLAAAKPKVAILGLEPVGKDAALATTAHDITTSLRDRVKASSDPYILAPGSDKELADEKVSHKCQAEQSGCIAAIGADLGADILIFGKLEPDAKGTKVALKVFVVAKKQTANMLVEVVPRDAKLAVWAKTAYGKLTGTE